MTFPEAMLEELADVPWLDGPNGRAIAQVTATDHETATRELKDAVLMRDPSLAPADAFPALAHDRSILVPPIYELASPSYQRAQLVGACDFWAVAGTGEGFVNIFAPYGFTAATCQFLSNHEVSGYWDGADWQSRVFGFLDATEGLFHTDDLWTDVDVDAGAWLEDESLAASTWDSDAKVGDIRYFRQNIRLTKGDYAYPVAIAVWLAGDGALPDGYWDSPGLYDDGSDWPEGDGLEQPLYWLLGNVWGQEAWMGDGVDAWEDGPVGEVVDLPEEQCWIAFPGED